MDLALLERTLADRGEPAYRTGQVWEWTARGVAGYEDMTNLPAPLRSALAAEVPFSTLTVADEARSRDGTVKALFRTADGHPVEAVLMRYRDGRRSLCVSSQSGCPLTCTFCATGQMRFGRNLTPSEILDQALHLLRTELATDGKRVPSSGSWGAAGRAGPEGTVRRSMGPESTVRPAASGVGGGGLRPPQASPARGLTNCVFMGMGEPMLNYENVVAAARLLPDVGITHRRTTISTVGWLPGLRRFVEEVEEPIRLALSLHAPGGELRSKLMPVNERYPLEDVLATCRRYFALRHRKVFVEYVMLGGVNDSLAHARELAALLDPQIFKVNLIPYNPTGMFEGSSREAIAAFKRELDRARIPATVRLTRGRDIAAACGQLAAAR
ncbi:MAG: rRNA (adenine2503-C2)-methyltransferase [Gaiellaceae bacterium]|nr:rRNA (adenine2503-C2)-methyltransferase [Gaiellaceae bacterium]